MTVSVSTHASTTGSQYPLYTDGYPRRWGRSGRLTVTTPRSAFRRISAAAALGSLRMVRHSGMMRSGWGEYHSSNIQSFHARVTAAPSSGSEHAEKMRPQKPDSSDGKLSEPLTLLISMSYMRASISYQPLRI